MFRSGSTGVAPVTGPGLDPLHIRLATDADSAAVIDLIAGVFAEYPGFVLDVDAEETELRAPASRFDRFWVLEETQGGAVVGCVAIVVHAVHAELKKLYVHRRVRGRGQGRRLAELVEAAARERGLPRIELWTDTRLETAHRLYERLGYVPTGRTRDLHDLSRTTEFHFEKHLGS